MTAHPTRLPITDIMPDWILKLSTGHHPVDNAGQLPPSSRLDRVNHLLALASDVASPVRALFVWLWVGNHATPAE
jgi:hypothetical protein